MASLDSHTRAPGGVPRATPPVISLPKGGGAVRGLGEKFAATAATGSSSLSVPVPTSPSRSGFGPRLTLTYDSSAGNGPFGIGWSLSLPHISRRTDNGLPQYRDAEESDVFVLSAAEDLVPVLRADGTRFRDETTAPGFVIERYRPRVEGSFARTERWTRTDSGDTHWRSITPENITTLYGADDASRVAGAVAGEPGATCIFAWLPCESYDDRGNAMVFEYAAEDDANVDRGQANERNRERSTGRYLKRIHYGNVVSRLVEPDLAQASWLFEVVFDYDEGHVEEVALDPARPAGQQHRFVRASPSAARPWRVRPDPFSTHRARFEVRTYRRCRRVLMFHHIPSLPTGEPGYDGLVRSIDLDYADLDYTQPIAIDDELAHQGSTRFASFIRAVTQRGYVRDDTQPPIVQDGATYATYLVRSLPPLELEYSRATIQDEVRVLDPDSVENLPAGLDGEHHWVDLDGEGVSGIITEQAGSWFYKPNLGDGRFGPMEQLSRQPSLAALGDPRQQFVDLAGDGQLDLAALGGPTPGFYERTADASWDPFRAFTAVPTVAWNDPNLRLVDLDGDGHADILVAENAAFTWYPSLAEEGFGPGLTIRHPSDEEHGPRLVFADGEQSVYLADMCGDGLTDLVRIRNDEVCYWPNMGYGRFGPKVTMDSAPHFDRPDRFEQARVRLADIDGSGTTDIIYLGHDGARAYFNQSGNRWTVPRPLPQFPHLDDVTSVAAADLLGNGTACLVWSSPLPGDARRPLRYIDLMGGTKPHLLVRTVNNLGAETLVRYAPSTQFSLADKRDGRPWLTRLPFPVHLVDRVETRDRVSGNRFVTRHAYHEGHFDGIEREFGGFGHVESWDSEQLGALYGGGELPGGTNEDASSHVPPVYTRRWFHTGVYLDRAHVSDHLAHAYYSEPGLSDAEARAQLLEDTTLPVGLTAEDEREACRALRGSLLREEVYALDGSAREPHPYSVREQSFAVRVLQTRAANRHAVFLAHHRETLDYLYERDPSDPRVGHTLTLEVDDFGDVLRDAAVGYGRRGPDPALSPGDQATQARMVITYGEQRYTNAVDTDAACRTPLPAESRTFEVTGLVPAPGTERLTVDELLAAGAAAGEIPYEQSPTAGELEKRLIEHLLTLYRRDDLTGPLPTGVVEPMALPFQSYSLALTPGLVTTVYGGRVVDAMLADEGRYVHATSDPDWWLPSGRTFYSPDPADAPAEEFALARHHFFLPRRFRDPFHTDATSTEHVATYDAYDLLLQETRDPSGNRVTAGERDVDPALPPVQRSLDYRVLQPVLVMDPNRNRATAAFDALGLIVATAVMGKPEEFPVIGDRIEPTFRANLTSSETEELLADPTGPAAAALLGEASTRLVYDLDAFMRDTDRSAPTVVLTLARESHASDPAPAGGVRIRASLSYSDGFARAIQLKARAEPGPTPQRDADGAIVVGTDGQPLMTTTDTSPRWVGSGWTVFDNKGNPVRQYEPFFTDTHQFDRDARIGVSPVLCHDPLGRVMATLHPDHSWERLRFDPWRQDRWDGNDAVLLDPALDDIIGPFARRLADADYLPTWHDRRAGGALGAAEQDAAEKAALHAATPSVVYADSLGRAFLTVAHNRVMQGGAPVEERYASRVVLDIEGNELEVRDANDRIAVRADHDMLGTVIHHAGLDAGDRWLLYDVAGTAIRSWDSRGHAFRTASDALRRPVAKFVREGAEHERMVARLEYGEAEPAPETANLRGQIVRDFDQSGVVARDAFDFKGNLLRSSRRLAREYRQTLDWTTKSAVQLEPDTFVTTIAYDALDRPTTMTTPDGSVARPTFNEAALLETIEVALHGAPTPTRFVSDIDYDARGRRTLVVRGNGTSTASEYDPLTFRRTRLTTTRAADAALLQDCAYSYDPAGNITRIDDRAQQTIYFANQIAPPRWDYTYDAVYRLAVAEGREHIGQAARPEPTPDDAGRRRLPHPGDAQAMRPYVERYEHDPVGNLLRIIHQAAGSGAWTREYAYDEPSLLDPARVGDRLSRTMVGAGPSELYAYDAHGNTLSMPHLTLLTWDFTDQLHASSRQVVVNGSPETTFYVYDAAGHRVRKVTETAGGARKEERNYLGNLELFRAFGAGGAVTLERETLHVMDDARRIALVETRTIGSDGSATQLVRYQLADHLGSAALELRDDGAIISYEEFYPFGSTSYQAGPRAVEVGRKRYRYTARERDEESGFSYHGARYYAPWLGRWLSPDPIGLRGGMNLYVYAHDNPIAYVDPSGTNPDPPDKRKVTPKDVAGARDLGNADRVPVDKALVEKPVVEKPGILSRLSRAAGSKLIDIIFKGVLLVKGGGPTRTTTRQEAFEKSQADVKKDAKAQKPGGAGTDPPPENGKRIAKTQDYLHDYGRAQPVQKLPPEPPPGGGGGGGGNRPIVEPPVVKPPVVEPPAGGKVVPEVPGGAGTPKGVGLGGAVVTGVNTGLTVVAAFQIARQMKVESHGYRYENVTFEDHLGTFIVERFDKGLIGWVRGKEFVYKKTYVDSPNPKTIGYTEEISAKAGKEFTEQAHRDYGYLDWKGDFVPGRLQQSIPQAIN